MSAAETGAEAHRAFLNAYYGRFVGIYDLTRKYYLFGRDRALDEVSRGSWSTLVEVGPGTGRNLRFLRKRFPSARLGGVEPCDEMLAHARARCPWATLVHGFAESADLAAVHGAPPDRVLFSYCLSMVEDPHAAIARARAALAPGGSVTAVDFADMETAPRAFRRALHAWIGAYRVTPLSPSLFAEYGARTIYGPGRYYVIARIPGPTPTAQ
jgi:S-adenosylmethionine-diacylgycerolhomoserine-N-methlytransferase